ncbi:MAG: hypothetical protein OEQ29_06020 [Alphaproteobacteria bacterium]|nr:hypothetical protein [Alphaproteobacteria bacterium]
MIEPIAGCSRSSRTFRRSFVSRRSRSAAVAWDRARAIAAALAFARALAAARALALALTPGFLADLRRFFAVPLCRESDFREIAFRDAGRAAGVFLAAIAGLAVGVALTRGFPLSAKLVDAPNASAAIPASRPRNTPKPPNFPRSSVGRIIATI